MRVELLGPMRILHRERELVPSLAKQRAILGLLASRVNEPVPVEHLIGALWDEPPLRAAQRVHTYAVGLRRMLGPESPGPSVSHSPLGWTQDGYILALNPESVDSRQFIRRHAHARRMREHGEFGDAAQSYEAALGLWRGDAYANISGPFARAERTRLEELRLTAVEEWCAIMLRAGRATEAVPMLLDLVSHDSLSQRLRRLLILALYRSGHRADALALFQQTRRLLRAELGVEPDEGLTGLYRQILADVTGRGMRAATG